MKALHFHFAALLMAAAHPAFATNQVQRAQAATPTSAVAKISQTVPQLLSNTVPKSVFVIPANPSQGKDPFFPESIRLGTSLETTNSQEVAASNLPLLLQGVSGPTGRKLAIINGRTLGENEEVEMTFGPTRVVVRCVEIHSEHVVIEVLGARRELRLRATK